MNIQHAKRLLAGIFYFQKKLLLPSIVIAIVIASISFAIEKTIPLIIFAKAYILTNILSHYFIYELLNKNEYFFYYNIG